MFEIRVQCEYAARKTYLNRCSHASQRIGPFTYTRTYDLRELRNEPYRLDKRTNPHLNVTNRNHSGKPSVIAPRRMKRRYCLADPVCDARRIYAAIGDEQLTQSTWPSQFEPKHQQRPTGTQNYVQRKEKELESERRLIGRKPKEEAHHWREEM